MPNGLNEIITSLEQQRVGIERALAALREIEGTPAPERGTTKKAAAKRKRGITPAGRKRLAEAMKRRWAIKRTAAQARKAGREK